MQQARILVFGDSITYGEWDNEGGWCDRLKRSMTQYTLDNLAAHKYRVFNLGIGSETSALLSQRIVAETDARISANARTIVIIAIGTNDSRYDQSGMHLISKEQYQQHITQIIQSVAPMADELLFVGLAPLAQDIVAIKNGYYAMEHIQAYDAALQKVLLKQKIPYITLMPEFAAATGQHLFSADGLHPNDQGHHIIYQAVKKALLKVL